MYKKTDIETIPHKELARIGIIRNVNRILILLMNIVRYESSGNLLFTSQMGVLDELQIRIDVYG